MTTINVGEGDGQVSHRSWTICDPSEDLYFATENGGIEDWTCVTKARLLEERLPMITFETAAAAKAWIKRWDFQQILTVITKPPWASND